MYSGYAKLTYIHVASRAQHIRPASRCWAGLSSMYLYTLMCSAQYNGWGGPVFYPPTPTGPAAREHGERLLKGPTLLRRESAHRKKAERSSPKEAPRALKADFMAATLPTHMQGLSVSKSDGNAKSSQDQSSVRTRICICQAGWPGPILNPP